MYVSERWTLTIMVRVSPKNRQTTKPLNNFMYLWGTIQTSKHKLISTRRVQKGKCININYFYKERLIHSHKKSTVNDYLKQGVIVVKPSVRISDGWFCVSTTDISKLTNLNGISGTFNFAYHTLPTTQQNGKYPIQIWLQLYYL